MGFSASNLANNDARRLEPHGGSQTIEHRDVATGVQRHVILDITLQFQSVFDQNAAILGRQRFNGSQ